VLAAEAVFSDPFAVVGGVADGPADAGVLVTDPFEMGLDGAHGDAELPGDGFVGGAVADGDQDFPFARGQRGPSRPVVAAQPEGVFWRGGRLAFVDRPDHVGEGVEVVGASVPCRSIGGDFFEYLELPSGDFGFALGDVAGKGPAAALLTAALQGLFTAHASTEGGPAATLARVNRALIRRAVQNRFATMAYGVLSRGGRLTYSNAGHNPPMVFTRGGVRRLEQGGLVLGLFPHAQYEEETLQLDSGDVLVVFSDGVSEAIDVHGEEFGDDRIVSCIKANRHMDPAALLDCLLAAVRQFSEGTVQRDDVTAMIVRV